MKYKRVKYIRWAVLLLLLAGVGVCAKMPSAGEWYAREVYPYVSVMLSGVASVVPFSLCEVTVALGVCLVLLGLGNELFS